MSNSVIGYRPKAAHSTYSGGRRYYQDKGSIDPKAEQKPTLALRTQQQARSPATLSPAQIAEIERRVKRLTAKELEYKQALVKNTSVTYGTPINVISSGGMTNYPWARGDKFVNNYQGDELHVRSLRIQGNVVRGSTGVGFVRLVVFQWHSAPPSGGVLASNVLLNATGTPASDKYQDLLSPRNVQYKSQFTILRDQIYTLNNTSNDEGSGNSADIGFDFKIKSTELARIEMKSTAADDMKGGIYLMWVAPIYTAASVKFWSEAVFTDNGCS